MGKIKIKLHRDLYRYPAIYEAARDFKKISGVSILKGKEYYIVAIDTQEPQKELLLKGNFLNYVLMLSKAQL